MASLSAVSDKSDNDIRHNSRRRSNDDGDVTEASKEDVSTTSSSVGGRRRGVQLGFSEALSADARIAHRHAQWSRWDGGQIGGTPSWINPRDLPACSPLRCRGCASRSLLRFVAQLYCPADEQTSNPAAFHRTLYVFVCPICVSTRGSVVVLRGQLPRTNDFFPFHSSNEQHDNNNDDDWKRHKVEHWAVHTCKICNQRAQHENHFCSIEHENEYHNSSNTGLYPSVYAMSELVVEEEPSESTTIITHNNNVLFPTDSDEDKDLRQQDLNDMVSDTMVGTTDPVTIHFYTRVGRCNVQEQCLRYNRWPDDIRNQDYFQNTNGIDDDDYESDEEDNNDGPLWISSKHCLSSTGVPPCPYCKSDRKFEFQIMPQMLHFLHDNNHPRSSDDDMDFGTIIVYTCTASCGNGINQNDNDDGSCVAYREEFAWRQPPL